MNDFWKKVYATKCPKDYKQHHRFCPIGIYKMYDNTSIFQVYRCEQCKKIVYEELEEIKLKECP